MLDRIIINEEKKQRFLVLILIAFCVSVILSVLNFFLGGNSLFLVALISLAFAYPLTKSARKLERFDIDQLGRARNIFVKYRRELVLFWSLFIGIVVGLYVSSPLILDFSYQQRFVDSIQGFITEPDLPFPVILLNNLQVAAFTFIISFFIYSALIFVIVWNASILTYYLLSLGSFKQALIHGMLLFSHGLFEIGGYVFAGIAGALLAFRLDLAYSSKYYKVWKDGKYVKKRDRRHTFEKLVNRRLVFDLVYLLILSVCFIVVGGVIEVL